MRKTIFAAAALALLLALGVAQAAVFTVTNTNDSGPGSLREAISFANTGLGADTINFGVSGVIILASQLVISDDLTIDGRGARIVISGNSRVRVLLAQARPTCRALTLIKLTIAKGAADDGAGLNGCGTLNVVDSSFDSNTSTRYGGAIVYFSSYPHDTVTVTNSVNISGSTFHGNAAVYGGGAIYLEVAYSRVPPSSEYVPPPPQTFTVTNSTFSRNRLTWAACDFVPCAGTAIRFDGRSSDKLVVTNSTLALNSLGTAIQWAVVASGSEVVFRNTILANSAHSRGRNCPSPGPDPRRITRITDGGGNLSSDASCGFSEPSSLNSTDPQLGPLRDNGGPTLTMSLLTGSPAIDQGVNAVAVDAAGLPLTTDQRGFRRISPRGGTVDRGAYEVAALSFAGFFVPVDNLPTINTVPAGSLIPVRFSLNGYQGQAIFAAGYPRVDLAACGNGAVDPIEETVKVGAGSLTYDTATDRYEYVLTTDPAWKSSCRKLSLKFFDGSLQEALFGFQ